MHMKYNALCLATLGLLLVVPESAEAGTVGYFVSYSPSSCIAPTDAIVQAGHTPVALAHIDAASLAPLDALILISCTGTTPANAALDSAVAAGMGLVVDTSDYLATTHPYLPGAPTLTTTFGCATDYDLPPASPIASGPAGSLDNASFDFPDGGLCGPTGYLSGPAPSGATPFLQQAYDGKAVALGYSYSSGRVAFSMSSFSRDGVQGMSWFAAGRSYLANALAWTLESGSGPATTCASEGYTGTKLTWCKNICEMNYSGATLDMWIHRWISRYRDLPYCVGEEEPELPPQET